MHLTRKLAVIALLSTALPLVAVVPAHAQNSGWYLGAGLGGVSLSDIDVEDGLTDSIESDNGWGGLAQLGYQFSSNWRAELEYSHRDNDVDSTNGGVARGDITANGIMTNVLYDFADATDFGLVPYVGLGVGLLNVDYEGVTPLTGSQTLTDDNWGVAGQGIVGMNYALAEDLNAFAQYQYTVANINVNTVSGTDVEADYAAHSVFVGMRYLFGDVAPAPQPRKSVAEAQKPAPVPVVTPREPVAQSRNYLIFFDLDKDVVKAEAEEILARAAADIKNQPGVVRIEMHGHADTTGSNAHNMDLSKRRAENAKRFLLGKGVTAAEIATIPHGEENLLVPTADGVLEPQNRRVEIIYSYKE